MGLYILRRLLLLVPLILGITLCAFLLLRSIPGDPALSLVGERADPAVIDEIRKEIGADRNVGEQYLGYLSLLLRGDFGRSYYTRRDVFTDMREKFPNTLFLAVCAMLIAAPAGTALGVLSVFSRSGALKRLINGLSIAGLSVPVFWNAVMIMLVLSLIMKLLPPSGTGGLQYVIMPAIVLAVPACATVARVTRTSIDEVKSMPFVTTARAKGVPPLRVTLVHVFRNAIIPVITIIGLDFGSYLNGAVVTETIFGWDGIGRFTMEGILKRDYPVILGCILFGTLVFVIVNLVTDIICRWLDPRVRFHAKGR